MHMTSGALAMECDAAGVLCYLFVQQASERPGNAQAGCEGDSFEGRAAELLEMSMDDYPFETVAGLC